MKERFLEVSQEVGAALFVRNISGEVIMLVRQKSLSDFMVFASNQGYLAGLGHRTAALEDSRLLPLVESRAAT
ncbi:hypothetical protein D1BOALGB6SA_1549 [Olavius sp. associated proteobacterium Delta 1]|nr:hypothetical protein D1BOALGB6SA_1549 [Olavius sp. associated proteobacterium Delta 1]